uniref:Uncharacterized protein n=1 Tax=Enterovibrio sp. FF_113 TaxID=1660266 RepID=A0A0H3ZR01_9GAMM|nr:hypothetical protein [Enterovibrio sp. FF_113]
MSVLAPCCRCYQLVFIFGFSLTLPQKAESATQSVIVNNTK